MLETILFPLLATLFAGILLLIVEYRTSWFQKHLLHSKQDNNHIPQVQSVEMLGGQLIGQSVTPLDELSSPTGDWFQIAQEVQTILEKIYCKEVDNGEYIPGIELIGIVPVKKSDEYELWFDLATNYQIGNAYVTVKPSGRITQYKFKAY